MSDNFEKQENEEVLDTETVEDTVEAVEDAVEEAIEEAAIADSAEAVVEEGMHETVDTSGAEDAEEPTVEYEIAESSLEDVPVKSRKGIVIGIVIALVVALLAGVGVLAFFIGKAPYNYLGYINVSGRTVQDIADMQGVSLEEFLKAYSLPSDMPGSTDESAAYYSIPTGVMAQMYGMDFATLKESLALSDEISGVSLRMKVLDIISPKINIGTTITEDTPWGITEGEAPLSAYVGESNLDSFKEEYGFGDEITGETKWKEVRDIVEMASLEARIEAEAAQAEDAAAGAEDVVDTAEDAQVEVEDVQVVSEDELPPEVAEVIAAEESAE